MRSEASFISGIPSSSATVADVNADTALPKALKPERPSPEDLRAAEFIPGELKPGTVLDDRFKVLELAHRGGMALIYKATDLESAKTVAVKLPLLKFESEPVTFSRFEREETIAVQIDHPFVLKVIPTSRPKSRPYLVMEYLQGRTLSQAMAATRPLPEKDCTRIASQICEALECLRAHGIVHRDLKPENLMLCEDGTVRLFDFGIAKSAHLKRLTFAGLVTTLGTPDYMAPEQALWRRAGCPSRATAPS
jgi:serine/threonine protein kinase